MSAESEGATVLNPTEQRFAYELAWAKEHEDDPTTWHETCAAVQPRSGAMCTLRRGHTAGHYQTDDWLGRYGTCWH